MTVGQWSTNKHLNGNIDPELNWEEGQPTKDVNNSARSMMAEIAKQLEDNNGVASSSSISGGQSIYVVELNAAVTSFDELRGFSFIPDADSKGHPLMIVKGAGQTALAAKPIVFKRNTNLENGYFKKGSLVHLTYHGGEYITDAITQVFHPDNETLIARDEAFAARDIAVTASESALHSKQTVIAVQANMTHMASLAQPNLIMPWIEVKCMLHLALTQLAILEGATPA